MPSRSNSEHRFRDGRIKKAAVRLMEKSKRIDKNNIEDIFALSPMQEEMLFHYLGDRESDRYFEQLCLNITGKIDKILFQQAWDYVAAKNGALRTVFRWEDLENPVQITLRESCPAAIYYDISEAAPGEKKKILEEIRIRDRKEKFDLENRPFRITLCKIAAAEYELIISNHHILFDGWSTGIILEEFLRTYDNLDARKPLAIPLKNKYKEFVRWLKNRDKERDGKFWRDYLRGFNTPAKFPGVLSILSMRGSKREERAGVGRCNLTFPQPFVDEMNEFVKERRMSLASLLYSAWGILIQKYTGSDDIVFGTTISGRPPEINGIESIVGFFTNTLPLRINTHAAQSSLELLPEVERALKIRDEFVYTSLLEIKRNSEIDAKENLFDSIFVLENYPIDSFLKEKNSAIYIDKYSIFYLTNYDLSVVVSTFGNFSITLTYDNMFYPAETMRQILHHFKTIAGTIISDPDIRISEIDILSEAEKREICYDFNDTNSGYPGDKTIHELFAEQAAKTPDNIALLQGEANTNHDRPGPEPVDPGANDAVRHALTYKELDEKSDRISSVLREKGVAAEAIVGIMAERSVELVIGIIGILKAGGAFLPIDPAYPRERVNYVLGDCGSRLLLTGGSAGEGLNKIITAAASMSLENLCGSRTNDSRINGSPVEKSHQSAGPRNLAYIIYTSGSSGRPKGVMIEHQGIVNYIWWASRQYVRGERLAFPLFTSIAFDLTMTSIFTPLLTGNTIVVYRESNKDILIERILAENKAGIVKLTPSHLKLIKGRRYGKYGRSNIKRFIVGGERFDSHLAAEIDRDFAGDVEIFNEYGPTEAAVGCMIYKFDPGKNYDTALSLGVPAANMQIYILDKDGRLVPQGITGEVYIAGDGLARGYLNRPGLTAEKFVVGPLSSVIHYSKFTPNVQCTMSDGRFYRTGDLARRNFAGSIEFAGRIDNQVKIRGYRIELEEIENKILNYKPDMNENDIQEADDSSNRDVTGVVCCTNCLLPDNYPGIEFDETGVCNVCREFDGYKAEANKYFKKEADLYKLIERSGRKNSGGYDCLLLYSGGKDSSYVLYRLIDMGLKVLTFTFDNGYISDAAFENINQTTSRLKVENIIYRTDKMNAIFVESLKLHCNVCTGCWRALNTYAAAFAYEKGINLVLSGLSRGQIFDMKLHGLFHSGIFAEEEIEKQLRLLRKMYHSREDRLVEILGVELDENIFEEVYFEDFFRYDDTPVDEILKYLDDKGWQQPKDTGFCSTNCLINDVGIYIHLKEKGYHNYAAPLSWDCRFGKISRERGLKETRFNGDLPEIHRILGQIGYVEEPASANACIQDAAVMNREDENGEKYICAYIVAGEKVDFPGLKRYLSRELPEYMIPSYFMQIDKIPLTANGKVDKNSLADARRFRHEPAVDYVEPRTDMERKISGLCKKIFGLQEIGIDDNFFDRGVNSYGIMGLNNELRGLMGKDIPVVAMFTYPTISALARYLDAHNRGETLSLSADEDESHERVNRGRQKIRHRKERIKWVRDE